VASLRAWAGLKSTAMTQTELNDSLKNAQAILDSIAKTSASASEIQVAQALFNRYMLIALTDPEAMAATVSSMILLDRRARHKNDGTQSLAE